MTAPASFTSITAAVGVDRPAAAVRPGTGDDGHETLVQWAGLLLE